MIIAGHDTTRYVPLTKACYICITHTVLCVCSTGVTWALLGLSSNLASQAKLRSELFSVQTPSPSMEELNALPYLDAVVRETLRYYSPVPHTVRVANRDDVIPLSEPWVDKHGVVWKELRYDHHSSLREKNGALTSLAPLRLGQGGKGRYNRHSVHRDSLFEEDMGFGRSRIQVNIEYSLLVLSSLN